MGPYNKARRKGSDIAGDHGDDDHDEDLEEGTVTMVSTSTMATLQVTQNKLNNRWCLQHCVMFLQN